MNAMLCVPSSVGHNWAQFHILADLREKLAPFYSEIGRPSIDPELMLRIDDFALARAVHVQAAINSCAMDRRK
jgi:hypothetical protein